jgi:acetylornithine deacetylase/succinyl-diaminopimelate desuccinylase-like protein
VRRVFGWNTFEILSPIMGNPNNPVNAVSPRAEAMCHMRFVPMPDASTFTAAILKHLDRNGLTATELEATRDVMQATRLDPGHPWVQWLRQSVEQTTGNKVDWHADDLDTTFLCSMFSACAERTYSAIC